MVWHNYFLQTTFFSQILQKRAHTDDDVRTWTFRLQYYELKWIKSGVQC